MTRKRIAAAAMAGLLGVGAAAMAQPEKAKATAPSKDAMSVIFSRKSVRKYQDKAVPKETLELLMKAGMAAPTAADKRPWAFVAVTDKKQLAALAAALPYGKMIGKAGAAIVVCGMEEKFFPGAEREFWVQDTSAATENILLAAEAGGLGAVWIGVYPDKARYEAVSRVLGLPATVLPLNVVSIGYPMGNEKPKDKFDPKKIHWEKW